MEILQLDLLAFGPFSERSLEFSPAGGGLHIVYGPNEAGKSSSLRGLKALLFGIPARTADNFMHKNRELRVAGKLRGSDGRELLVVRRKGNKNTLLGADGQQLDDGALEPFLRGVGVEVFDTLFGIDHEGLVRGGQEILEQRGEVGQALFAASMGSSALHGILESLEQESEELFKPRGTTPVINAAIRRFSELKRNTSACSLSTREWAEARDALDRTNGELETVQVELAQSKHGRHRLQRIRRALPRLTRWQGLNQELERLGEVVLLPEDFGQRREQTTLELENARTTAKNARANLARLREQLVEVREDGELLEAAELVESLHSRLGGHRKALQDRPRLQDQQNLLLSEAEALLKDIRPELTLDAVEQLHTALQRRVKINELAGQRQALTDRVRDTGKTIGELKRRLERERERLRGLVRVELPTALRKEITLARKRGDLDETIAAEHLELGRLERMCQDALARLGGVWQGTLAQIGALPLPVRESMEPFEERYTKLEQRVQWLREKHRENRELEGAAQRQLAELEFAGSVPTEEDLMRARSGRDRAWSLLRRQWLEGETVAQEAAELDPERPLPDAFENRIVDADEVADRLRREAQQVQKKASHLAVVDAARKQAKQLEGQLNACDQERQQIDVEWAALWRAAAIEPLSPREMRAWLDELEKLQARYLEVERLRAQIRALESIRTGHLQVLQRELNRLGERVSESGPLEALLSRGEEVAGNMEHLARERVRLEADIGLQEQVLQEALAEQRQATEALETWQGQWQDAVHALGLGADASPPEAAAMLETVRDLFEKLKEARTLRNRIEAIDGEAQRFVAEVSRVAMDVAPELAKLPLDRSIPRLVAQVSEARIQRSNREQLVAQIREVETDLGQAKQSRKVMEERLDTLCREAGCREASELAAAEQRSARYQELRERRDALELELQEIGEGRTLPQLEAEVAAADPDTLEAEIDSLTSRVEEALEPREKELLERRGEQRMELERMDGSDEAAAIADEAQSVLEEIRENADQYLRLRLASRILRDEIEGYRQQHQGPILERASEHFSVLTQDSFACLRTDFDEKDEPVLAGIRPDGAGVGVDGMSSGTRDQLYLALRLASLERYLEKGESMPFIVDDIMVHFDDNRSRATLETLAKLAGKTQVIMFTHHRSVVDQAEGLSSGTPVKVHEL